MEAYRSIQDTEKLLEELQKVHANKSKNVNLSNGSNRSKNGKLRGIVKVSGNHTAVKVPILNETEVANEKNPINNQSKDTNNS